MQIYSPFSAIVINSHSREYILITLDQRPRTLFWDPWEILPLYFTHYPFFCSSDFALFSLASHSEVSRLCDITIISRHSPIQAFNFNRGLWYLAIPGPKFSLFCDISVKSSTVLLPWQQCLITLPCRCELRATDFILPKRFSHCYHNTTTTLYSFNPFLFISFSHLVDFFPPTQLFFEPPINFPAISLLSNIFHYFAQHLAPSGSLTLNFSEFLSTFSASTNKFSSLDHAFHKQVEKAIRDIQDAQPSFL